jgi:hypothetical protein
MLCSVATTKKKVTDDGGQKLMARDSKTSRVQARHQSTLLLESILNFLVNPLKENLFWRWVTPILKSRMSSKQ